jgi:hypothetical protein
MAKKPKARGIKGKAKRKPTKEKPQRARFLEAGRIVGVDESGLEFERALKVLVPSKVRRS